MSKSLEQRIYDGQRCREIIENEAFKQAFADIEAELTKQWMESPARDAEGREKIWLYRKMLDTVRLQLQSTFDTGRLAELEMDHKRTLAERAKYLGMSLLR